MRDILDALEGIHTNKKQPLDVAKEINKKPAVMKALSLESETTDVNEQPVPRQYTMPISKHLMQLDNMQAAMRREVLKIPSMDDGDLTDQVTTMMKLLDSFDEVMQRSFAIIPESKEETSEETTEETTEETVNEGGMKQAEIEVQDWAEKYNKYKGTNADELANGYLQAVLNTGIMSDAYDGNEVEAFNKLKGYSAGSNDSEWADGDHEDFTDNKSGVSPITGGMFNGIEMIKTKYGIDDDMVSSIMGYFDEGKTINSEEQDMETTKKDTVEVAVEDLARVLELAGLKSEAEEKDFDFSKDNLELCDTCDKPTENCDCEGHDHKAEEIAPIQANNEVELDEYSNSPDEEYFDTDTQLNKMSGGLNGPKKQFKKEYPGDNPLAVDLQDKLAKMLSDM